MNRSQIFILFVASLILNSSLAIPSFGLMALPQDFEHSTKPQAKSNQGIPLNSIPTASSPTIEIQNFPSSIDKSSSVPTDDNAIELILLDQLKDMRHLDFSKAYYAYMSNDFKKAISLDVFRAFVRKSPTLYRNKDLKIESKNFNGVLAIVHGKLTSGNDQTARVIYELIQEDGEWKIRKIDLTPLYQSKKVSRTEQQ